MSIVYGFSDIYGGVSTKNYTSLNLALHVGDNTNLVIKNREIFANKLGFKKENLVFMDQNHSDKIYVVDKISYDTLKCDAVITNLKNTVLCVMVADCIPILLFDKQKNIISAIHVGRAGICLNLITKVVKKIISLFGSDTDDLKLVAGPHIQGKCYEVGNLNLGKFNKFKRDNHFYMNEALISQISTIGINDYKISNICTHCDKRYFSYRRDKITGRFCGYIYII